ncbi:hypothetical protein CROQUDRAFT_694174, partial [Cronartium quercuum f. sp. fusiforme G11]
VITFVGIFIGWLHLFCGLSGAKCQMAWVFILRILEMARNHPLTDDTDKRQLPKDTRTTIKMLSISPDLEKNICCPSCFSLYKPSDAPWTCTFKKSSRARDCSEELFELRTIWFLLKATTEDEILKWSDELNSTDNPKIYDIQQSEAWNDITWPEDSLTKPKPLNLVFSLFIDWFNPRGNKKCGAQQSLGVLAFNCINLPPSLRNLLQNTCIAGITPGPNAPDMTTISHVLKEHVDDLLLLEEGISVVTSRYPQGQLVRMKLLPLLGDMVGMHKVAGFASHSATFYCSWCWGKSTDSNRMQIAKLRTKEEVLDTSARSNAANSLHEKETILSKTGV